MKQRKSMLRIEVVWLRKIAWRLFRGYDFISFWLWEKRVYYQQIKDTKPNEKNTMQYIIIMGSGAVGGFYGAHLAQAEGLDVTFIARGAHGEALRKKGLRITGLKEMHLPDIRSTENPSSVENPPDLVLVSVKSHDTSEAIGLLRPVIHSHTQILTIQNGLENYDRLCEAFGCENVIRGFCKIGVELTEPGVIEYRGLSGIVLGEEDGSLSNRVTQIRKTLEHAGIAARVSRGIRREAWLKFIWNGIFNMLTGLTGATTDRIFGDEHAYATAWQLFDEMQAVAGAQGILISTDEGRTIIDGTRELGAFRTSTWQDRRKGKRLEYDAFCGYITRRAADLELQAPVNRALFSLYRLMEQETEPITPQS